MSDRLTQYLNMLPWLVARPHVSIEEFMAEFNLSRRKAKEVLRMLTYVGPDQGGGGLVDIDFEDGYVYVRNSQNFDRPVRFNRFEANALLGGLVYLKGVAVTENIARIDALISKISAAANQMGTPFEVIGYRVDAGILNALKDAADNETRLQIEYSDGAGDVSTRVIEPQRIEALNDLLYVAAWCQLKEAPRTFRVDRIMHVASSALPSTNSTGVVAQVDVIGSASATVLTNIEALEDFSSAHIKSQEQQADGRWLVELTVGSLDWLAGLILASGGEMEAVEPLELRSEVLARANNWLEVNPA